MLRRGNLGTLLGLGVLAELAVFVLVIDRIGFGATIGLSLACSLFGAAMLRRSGLDALQALRRLAEEPGRREGAFIDGMLGACGAILLIVPGFVSDLLGLALLAPSGRQWVSRRFGLALESHPTSGRGAGPRTIDLGDGDFTRLDNAPNR